MPGPGELLSGFLAPCWAVSRREGGHLSTAWASPEGTAPEPPRELRPAQQTAWPEARLTADGCSALGVTPGQASADAWASRLAPQTVPAQRGALRPRPRQDRRDGDTQTASGLGHPPAVGPEPPPRESEREEDSAHSGHRCSSGHLLPALSRRCRPPAQLLRPLLCRRLGGLLARPTGGDRRRFPHIEVSVQKPKRAPGRRGGCLLPHGLCETRWRGSHGQDSPGTTGMQLQSTASLLPHKTPHGQPVAKQVTCTV